MKLSIITINYNNVAGLEKTLQSVDMQTCNDFEHVIIDGGSTDGSAEIIKAYAEKSQHPIKWVSERDNGIYNAMNKGIRMASGDYIQILNSGDMLYNYTIEEQMFAAIENYGNPPILYGNMIKQWTNGRQLIDVCRGNYANTETGEVEWTLYDFIYGTINHDPTFVRHDLFDKYGLYDENLKICSDWKWFVSAVVFGAEKVFYTNLNVTIFDMTGVSETNITFREEERKTELRKMFPEAVLKDYYTWHFPISQATRLKKYHLWWCANFIERALFKLEKWRIIR